MKEFDSVHDFKVVTLEFGGLAGALNALRLPFGKERRSIAEYCWSIPEDDSLVLSYQTGIALHAKDKELMSTLVKRGDEHAKILRGVCVWAEINAPRYWWIEMSTYRVGVECLSSESTMHVEGKGLDTESLVEMKENLREGHMQKRVVMFSYQALRRIYFQRRNHRLPQWKTFCEWIETLPYADEFITAENG